MPSPVPFRLSAVVSAALFVTVSTVLCAAVPEDVQRAKAERSCVRCELSDASFSGLPFPRGDFSGSNLTGASFYGSDLRGANFSGALLTGANLKAANLEGAVNAVLVDAITDDRTVCPSGVHGPCQ